MVERVKATRQPAFRPVALPPGPALHFEPVAVLLVGLSVLIENHEARGDDGCVSRLAWRRQRFAGFAARAGLARLHTRDAPLRCHDSLLGRLVAAAEPDLAELLDHLETAARQGVTADVLGHG